MGPFSISKNHSGSYTPRLAYKDLISERGGVAGLWKAAGEVKEHCSAAMWPNGVAGLLRF